jgi:hypothetical protein
MATKERRQTSLVQAGHQLNAINWPLVTLSALFLSLRIFLKLRQQRPLWWDDYVLIISWVRVDTPHLHPCNPRYANLETSIQLALLAYSIMFALALGLGYGGVPTARTATPTPEDAFRTVLFFSVSSSLLILANLWSKTSFGITLLRLPLGRWRVRLVCALIATGTGVIGASAYFVWIQCLVASPAPWSPYVGARCLAPDALIGYSIFVACFSAVMDFAFVVLPWKMLWGMEMRRSERAGVMFAMGLGALAGVAALVKSTIFPRVYDDDHLAGLQVSGWGAIETSVSICAASIPILRALVRQGGLGGGMPQGYQTGATGMGQSDVRSVFFQRTWLAPSRTTSGVDVGVKPVDEVLAGKVVDEEVGRTSLEMEDYGNEVRPREFTA